MAFGSCNINKSKTLKDIETLLGTTDISSIVNGGGGTITESLLYLFKRNLVNFQFEKGGVDCNNILQGLYALTPESTNMPDPNMYGYLVSFSLNENTETNWIFQLCFEAAQESTYNRIWYRKKINYTDFTSWYLLHDYKEIGAKFINGWTGEIQAYKDGRYGYIDFATYGETSYAPNQILIFAEFYDAKPSTIKFGTATINDSNGKYLGIAKIDIRPEGLLCAIFSETITADTPICIVGDLIYPLY